MKEIGVVEGKSQMDTLLDLAAQGEDVLITRSGKLVTRLVPLEGALRNKAAAVRIRENAKAERLGKFDWAEWQAFTDEGRR